MMVTPIGICLSYYVQSNNFIFVEFNGERIKLYDNGKLSVTDAAMQMQFPNDQLFPRKGEALLFTVNGKTRMVRGEQGEAAIIRVNGNEADMYTQLHNGDRVVVTPSTEGEPAVLELGKLSELGDALQVYVNGRQIRLPKTAEVNGHRENEFYRIGQNDDIRIRNSYTVKEIAEFLDVPLGTDIKVNDTAVAGRKLCGSAGGGSRRRGCLRRSTCDAGNRGCDRRSGNDTGSRECDGRRVCRCDRAGNLRTGGNHGTDGAGPKCCTEGTASADGDCEPFSHYHAGEGFLCICGCV